MNKVDIKALKELLNTPKNIVIIPHKNPDGDAIGSTLGLFHYLNKNGHNATVIAPNDYPHFLKWMPGENTILKFESEETAAKKKIYEADIIFTLDFNSLGRIGDMEETVAKANAIFIMIDHHQQPDSYAQYMYSDVSMSSTCEMVYHFINFLDDEALIDSEIAHCLYTGIMTDTGSFRFASTTSTTHLVAAKLIEKGANNSEIHNKIYDTNSTNRLHLLGRALNNLVVINEYRTAYITLTRKELSEFDFKKGDTEGIVNYALSVEGIIFALIFIEDMQEDYIKISLRSKGDFSVNQFSRSHFNGGGHDNAAGGRSDLNMQETVDKLITLLPTYKKELQ
jgi:phosphoesterase RecJ-like protein